MNAIGIGESKNEILLEKKYPFTDRCIALLKTEKPEVMAEKNPLLSFFSGLPISFETLI